MGGGEIRQEKIRRKKIGWEKIMREKIGWEQLGGIKSGGKIWVGKKCRENLCQCVDI